MEIIPVIDLKRGQVVRARLGRREEYRPIETPLSATSDPIDVARGLLSLFPFATLYIADLDAIESAGSNDEAIALIRAALPDLSLWVDNGMDQAGAARRWLAAGWGSLVIGSESQKDPQLLGALADESRVVLSLDFRGDAFQGAPSILTNPHLWPECVIAMTLAPNCSYSARPALWSQSSVVQTLVKASGKNNSTVFFWPRFALSETSCRPSAPFDLRVKSGALVPTERAMM